MSFDDYTDARDEFDDCVELEAHQEHEDAGYIEGCDFCAMEMEARNAELAIEAEAIRAEMRLDALIALFVQEPCEQDREAARRLH